MQMDRMFFWVLFFFSEPFVVWALSHCRQIGLEHEVGYGKLANGLAGVPSSPTRKDKFKTFLAVVGRLWYSLFFVLIKLISLLGKNFAEDRADFGNDSLASRRQFGIGREECFQICICLWWPHAFRTQDLKHTLSTAYLVKHATPRPWCICVDSRDSLANTFETREFWTYRSESFMGVVSNRRRRRCR